jgi:transposase
MTPGRYTPDPTAGITRLEDLPPPRRHYHSRNYRRRRCPCCGRPAYRHDVGRRTLHDLSTLQNGHPIDLVVVYSKHRCQRCQRTFSVEPADLAPPGSQYTHRVIDVAVRVVVEDSLPYRTASWHLWRDHRVFVPYATIQNWVEAAGKKSWRASRDRLPG